MPHPADSFRVCLSALAIAFITFGQPALSAENKAADPAAIAALREKSSLIVARNGTEVNVRWELPPVDLRSLELLRNTQRDPAGRDRVASVSKKKLQHVDQVPDASATYWYWLKITLKDGRTFGIGPVATPSAEVWSPSS